MFLAMNRFKVVKGKEEEFENIWRNRESRLGDMPGFISFNLFRGATEEDHTLYASHSVWSDRDAFEAWRRSEQYRDTHRQAGKTSGLYLGQPQPELFTVVEGA